MTDCLGEATVPTDMETARRVTQFKFSIDLFERNYAELDAFLQYLEAPTVALSLVSPEEQWRRHIAMREIEFRLHNYVASAQSLIDHARVLYQQLYEPQGLFVDYVTEVNERFAQNPLAQFVRMLRNMAQHYRLPNIHFETHLEPGSLPPAVRAQLLLLVADLRHWNGWNPPALGYLDTAGESLDIHRVITEYHEQIMDFYRWFETRQSEIHGPLPTIYSQLLRFGRSDNNSWLAQDIAARLNRLEQQPDLTFRKLVDALSPALTILDQQQLEFYRHSAQAFVLRAVDIIESRFGAISGLRERLMQLLTRHQVQT